MFKIWNGESPCQEYNSKAPKTDEEKQIKSIKAKGLKRGFKKNVSDDAFKNATLYEKPLRLTQKQIKSKNLTMTMEDVEKHVIPVSSKKKDNHF